jgi:hypothetical protein
LADSNPRVPWLGTFTVSGESMTNTRINKRGIQQLMNEIQREFDKHPIRVPVVAESPVADEIVQAYGPPPSGTAVYQGPVIIGNADGAQLAWGNNTVQQTAVNRTEEVAPGFEAIAAAVALTLGQLPAAGLDEEDEADAKAVADEILVEVTQPQPDRGKIRRAITALKGFLAPIATGLARGGGQGAQEWAKTAIEQLGSPL